jgi:hypothetical protein
MNGSRIPWPLTSEGKGQSPKATRGRGRVTVRRSRNASNEECRLTVSGDGKIGGVVCLSVRRIRGNRDFTTALIARYFQYVM